MQSERFIESSQALEAARREISRLGLDGDPLFAPWVKAQPDSPVLVKTVFGADSYWLVPVVIRDRAVGFVRVLGDGRVAAAGAFYQDPSQLDACPSVVTGLTAQEALEKALGAAGFEREETISKPVFVHDGPPGREAWLVEIKGKGKPARWIFVTPAFTYERPAGEAHDDTLEG